MKSDSGPQTNPHREKSFLNPGRIYATLCSVRTGIVLLILLGLAAAAGTLVLQRPLTDPEQLQRVYAPDTLRWLDRLGLTDVFHSWWFAALLTVLCVNIVVASVERLPEAWRYFARPYRRPEPHFLAGLRLHKEIPLRNEESGMETAAQVFRQMGLKPQRVLPGTNGSANEAATGGRISLYAEQHRLSRLAPYVVHASLLLIFAGGIADALWGYRGYLALTQNQESNQIELRDGSRKILPFTVHCESAGREDYPDGSPRRWWSQLSVTERGREVKKKLVEVNEPLVHRGVRFYQSGYGSTGEVSAIQLRASPKSDPNRAKNILLRPSESVPLDEETSVNLAAFLPDFVLNGTQIENNSPELNNPAIQLQVRSRKSDEAAVWLFPRFPDFARADSSPYAFTVRDIQMGYFTGLQVSHEPGQWAVWAGVLLMGVGLAMAFYFVHGRFWAVPVNDGRGRLVLWVGASASKNRDEFEERFQKLAEKIEQSLKSATEYPAGAAPRPVRGSGKNAKSAEGVPAAIPGKISSQFSS
jgi:cytochrome c biogenesis protein